jgi:hypothetical protein
MLYFYAYCTAYMVGPISGLKSFEEKENNHPAPAKNCATTALS